MRICGIDPSINSTGKVIMELDDALGVVGVDFYGYTHVKKRAMEQGNLHIDFVGTKYESCSMPERQCIAYEVLERDMAGVEYIGIEDYAYGKATGESNKSMGMVFQIGEFCGGMRLHFYRMGIGLINYGIMQIKRFATGSGSADKVAMCNAFREEYPALYPAEAFSLLPQYESPMADMCDAFWMCEILRNHLKFEKFGPESIPETQLALLTYSTKGSMSLVDSPLVKMGVEYDKPVRHSKKRHKTK